MIRMIQNNNTNLTSKANMLSIFEYLDQHSFLYSNLMTNKGVPTFKNRLLAMVQEITKEQIDEI